MAITIRDIARVAGVSRATVSRVLNQSGYVKEETKEKVEKAIKDLNYIPNAIARSLSTNKTNTIGVVVPEINNPFFGDIVRGIGEKADELGLNIILFNTDNNEYKELKSIELLKEQRIQGVLITPCYTKSDINYRCLKRLQNAGVPIVLLDGYVKYEGFNSVFINHEKGAYNATKALIDAGHKKIAIINGFMETRIAQERNKGYKKALKDNHIDYICELKGNYNSEMAYNVTKNIITMENRPTAIFVTSNMMILGCIKALYELKVKVPEDIALIGFDNVDILNSIGLNISYAYGPSFEMGVHGMKILNRDLNNYSYNNNNINEILMPQLKLKGSERKM